MEKVTSLSLYVPKKTVSLLTQVIVSIYNCTPVCVIDDFITCEYNPRSTAAQLQFSGQGHSLHIEKKM